MRERPVVATTVMLVLPIVAMLAARQTSQPAATSTGAYRTSWGEPDLQGIWNHNEQTPLERPDEYAGREFLTDEEIDRLDRIRTNNIGASAKASIANRDAAGLRGTEQDVAGAYNNVFNSFRRTGRRTSLIVDPPDGKIPPLTPQARERNAAAREYLQALLQGTSGGRPGPPSPRRAEPPPFYNLERMNRADGPEDRSMRERCMGTFLPVYTGQDSFFRIVQSPKHVAIYYEDRAGGGNRIIPIDGAAPLPPRIRQFWGDAHGRWEGDTLVVETTNFSVKTEFMGAREDLHLLERFTRVDGDTLRYQVTITDPTTWTRPWTIEVDMTRHEDRHNRIFESACHEGNFGLIGILSNMRAAERAFAEGRGPDPALQDNATAGGAAGRAGTEPTPVD